MAIHPLAGQPAPIERIDRRPALERAYFQNRPDPVDPRQLRGLRHQRASGNSAATALSPRRTSWRSRKAICDYRRDRGIDGPLFMGKDTHALSGPAQRTALEVLAAEGRRDNHPARRRRDAHAGRSRTRFSSTTAAAPRTSRRHRDHAFAQSARRWRLQVQPAQRRTGRHRRHRLDSGPRQRICCTAATPR